MFDLESQIRKWRRHVQSTAALGAQDVEELESHLRDSVDGLTDRGVSEEEAFLVSIRRMGDADALRREFAKVSTERAWRQLLVPAENGAARQRQQREIGLVIGLALLAGLLGKIPALLGYPIGEEDEHFFVYAKNASLFAFTPVALYLIWLRSLSARFVALAAVSLGAAAALVNLYPSVEPQDTVTLTIIHLPIAFLLLLMVLYGGPGWRKNSARLDFVRFAGEAFIYSVLIGLGGIVLLAVATIMFDLVGIDIGSFVVNWPGLFGLLGIPIVAAFLVEKKKGVIESIAPILAQLFTPLFLAVLLGLVGAMAVTGQAPAADRDLLIAFDLVLALVLGLVLYTMSARDAERPAGWWDAVVLALVVSALIADGVALTGIVGRLSAYGFTPNRAAALGLNLTLLLNLGLLAVGYLRFLAGRSSYQSLIDLQMRMLPIHALWAAVVALGFPPLFGFA